MTLTNDSKLLVILGPTATGKTDLGLILAKKFNGELVSCDSRQVYTGLDIGTGKMPSGDFKIKKGQGFWEIGGIRVWMYDVISPKIQYTVADYVKNADTVIRNINKREKLPIVVGGTGLYLKALLDGLSNLSIPIDDRLRARLQKLTISQLQVKLQKLAPLLWESMNYSDRQNPRRLIRAIELAMSNHEGDPSLIARDDNLRLEIVRELSNVLKIGLTAPREVLYQMVDKRVVSRINQGIIEEAKRLYQRGLTLKRMRQLGLEYGVLADYLKKKISIREELIKILQGKIHGYVRRQLTWFKKERDIFWFDITDKEFKPKIAEFVSKWYDNEIKGGDGQY